MKKINSNLIKHAYVCADGAKEDGMPQLKRSNANFNQGDTEIDEDPCRRRRSTSSGCPILKRLLSLTCIAMCLTPAASIHDVRRLNHGVMFQAITEVEVISEVWKSSFLVEVPKDVKSMGDRHHSMIIGNVNKLANRGRTGDTMEKTNIGTAPSYWWLTCLATHDSHVHGTNRYNTNISQDRANQYPCHMFAPLVRDMVAMTKRAHDELVDVSESIQEILPIQLNQTKVSKRAILEALGRLVGHSILGYSMQKDVDVMMSHVNQVTATLRSQTGSVKHALSDMSMLSRTTNERMKNMLSLVENNALSSMAFAENIGAELGGQLHFTTYLAAQGALTRQALRLARNHYEKWLQGLIELQRGHLSLYLIPPRMLRDKIKDISTYLADMSPHYRMIYKNPNQVYREAKFLFIRLQGHLLITIDFPLKRYEPFSVYRIILVPMPVPHQTQAAMYLKTDEVGIALNHERSMYYYLNREDMTELQIKGTHTAKRRVFRTTRKAECLISIFLDNTADAKELCSYTIVMDDLKQEIKWLSEEIFQATALGNYSMSCRNGALTHASNCELCFLEVKPTCSVLASSWIVPVRDRGLQNQSEKVSVKYSLNRPLAIHFLTEEQLQSVHGAALFPERPNIEAYIPPIRMHVNDAQKFIAEDKKLQLQMTKTVESLKRDSLVYNDVSSVIVDGLQDLPVRWEWSDYLGFATTAVVVLLILQLLYLSVRIRQIALTVMIMKQCLTSTAEAADDFDLFKAGTFPPIRSTERTALQYSDIVDTIKYNETIILLSAFALIVMWFIMYKKVIQYIERARLIRIRSHLTLQFTNGFGDVNIKIKTVSGLLEHLTIRGETAVGDVRVSGLIRPRLRFVWFAQVEDSHTKKSWHVDNVVAISYVEAYLLRILLSEEYRLIPLFESRGVITTCKFAATMVSIEDEEVTADEMKEFRQFKARYEQDKNAKLKRTASMPAIARRGLDMRRFSISPGEEAGSRV